MISPDEMKKYALIGAHSELERLNEETKGVQSFIGRLQTPITTTKSAAAKKSDTDSPASAKPRTNRAWSADARKAVSERMKRYWAGRRRAKQAKDRQAAAQTLHQGKK